MFELPSSESDGCPPPLFATSYFRQSALLTPETKIKRPSSHLFKEYLHFLVFRRSFFLLFRSLCLFIIFLRRFNVDMSQTDRSDSGEGSGNVSAIIIVVVSGAAETASAPSRSSTTNPSRYAAKTPRFDDDALSAIAVVAAYVQSPVSPATIVAPDRRHHASPSWDDAFGGALVVVGIPASTTNAASSSSPSSSSRHLGALRWNGDDGRETVDSDLEAAAAAADVIDDDDDAILPEPLTPPRMAALRARLAVLRAALKA